MDEQPTHLDIFSGIGGFALAARWAGFRTVAFCEKDERCRRFLEKTWGVTVEPDIRTLDASAYRGISLLTGGPPCQPASRAGEQRGAEDDRWLWPEALRVLDETRPDSVVFENPPGIYDVGIDGILSEMERIGYAVQTFDIPACSVDSPQLRYRVWIVGFLADAARDSERGLCEATGANGERIGPSAQQNGMASAGRERSWQDEQERRAQRRNVDGRDCASDMANGTVSGRERADTERGQNGCAAECVESHWHSSVWVPCADDKLRRAPDESVDVAHGLHRSILVGLGNAIVPQVAFEILRGIRQLA